MKNKQYLALALVLAILMPGAAGCEKEVKSQVIAEKGTSGETKDHTKANQEASQKPEETSQEQEENVKELKEPKSELKETINREPGETAAGGKPEGSQSSLREQLHVPEVYTEEIQTSVTARTSEREVKVPVSIKADDVPVEVPDVTGAPVRKVTAAQITQSQVEGWMNALGEKYTDNQKNTKEEDMDYGELTIGGLPYFYLCGEGRTFWLSVGDVTIEKDGYRNEKTGEILMLPTDNMDVFSLKKQEPTVKELAKKLGFLDFRLCAEKIQAIQYWKEDGVEVKSLYGSYEFERMVDGIPVNYVNMSLFPAYEGADTEGLGEKSAAENNVWNQERLAIGHTAGILHTFEYQNPLEISEEPGEETTLLPFEEIRDIFQELLPLKLMGREGQAVTGGNDLETADGVQVELPVLYPGAEEGRSVSVELTKIKFGYMRIRQEDGNAIDGLLIPVWDFYGTWTADTPDERALMERTRMEEEDVSLLTLDARDGTVVERLFWY